MTITSKKYVKLATSIMVRLAALQNAEKNPLVSYHFQLSYEHPQNIQIARFVRKGEHDLEIAESDIQTAYATWKSFPEDLEKLLDTLSQWETECLPEEEEDTENDIMG